MEALLLWGILLLNVCIAVWNCYAVGSAWKDTMTMGGGFNRLVLWSAVIQSGVGFSMPILLILTWGGLKILTGGEEPQLTAAEAKEIMTVIFNLWYVAVIFPILGSGLAIWAHSLRIAYKQRDFASIAAASWNSFAQIHNTLSAINNLGGAFGNLDEFFGKALGGKGDARDKVAIFVILVVIVSLVLGFMIAIGLVRYFARQTESRIEEYVASRRGGARA